MAAEEYVDAHIALHCAAWAISYYRLVPLHCSGDSHNLLACPHLTEPRYFPQGVIHHFPVNVVEFLMKKNPKTVEISSSQATMGPEFDIVSHIRGNFSLASKNTYQFKRKCLMGREIFCLQIP
jgi:hypothetical protein